MTVASTRQSRVVVSNSGFSNPINLDQYVEDSTHLKVYADQVLLAIGTHYTLAGVQNDATGVDVTITATGLALGPVNWVVLHDPPLDQGANLSLGGRFGLAYENAIDALTRRFQAVAERLSRNINLPIDTTLGSIEFPEPVALRGVRWNDAGTGLENTDGPIDEPGSSATAAAASAAASAASAVASGVSATASDVARANAEVAEDNAVIAQLAAAASATASAASAVAAAASAVAAANAQQLFADGRLSLTTGLAVTVADVAAAGTLYYVPKIGSKISLYNGAAWIVRSIGAQISLVLTGLLTNARPHDVFCYDNAGTPTLEVLAWTNDTTRATALVLQDGVLCKSGALTRRYLGTLYATGTGTTEDSKAKRYLWNMYNRVKRTLRNVNETADNWTYTTATIRQANANAANQLDFVRGLDEDAVEALIVQSAFNGTAARVMVGIGLDVTNAFSADCVRNGAVTGAGGTYATPTARYVGYPGLGRHILTWLEWSAATGSTTWNGDDTAGSGGVVQTGMTGSMMA